MPISDKRLRAAAKVAGDAIMASYAADAEPDHAFSPEFEQKMQLLIQQTRKKSHYALLQKVASVILAIALGCTIWLSADIDARAAVFGWIKEQYENIVHYHFKGDVESTAEPSYELGWVPEGYHFDHRSDRANSTTVVYTNESANILTLFYTTGIDYHDVDFYLFGTVEVTNTVTIGDSTADLYIDAMEDASNAIVWEDQENNRLFAITVHEKEAILLKLAKNVIPSKK